MSKIRIDNMHKKTYSLEKTKCTEKIQNSDYTDHYINGVTYRVWSTFEGMTKADENLSRLMLRKLESGEPIGEVVDEFEEGIKRVSDCFFVTM